VKRYLRLLTGGRIIFGILLESVVGRKVSLMGLCRLDDGVPVLPAFCNKLPLNGDLCIACECDPSWKGSL
jgi:hypothetical protein